MNRSELKALAREYMRQAQPHPAWVTAVYLLLPVAFVATVSVSAAKRLTYSLTGGIALEPGFGLLGGAAWAAGLTPVLCLLYYLITVGYSGYCLRVSRGLDAGMHNLLDHINRPMRFIALAVLTGLAAAAPTLAAVFGGIIAGSAGIALTALACAFVSLYISLGFSQAAFVAIDRPELGVTDCIRESWDLMRGRRREYCVLVFSFFLWQLLAGALVFPTLFVKPYTRVTLAGYFNIITGWDSEE